MTEDKFIKKQMYACPKCEKIFPTKDEAIEHFKKMHEMIDKYLGSYIISNDGFVGKVIDTMPMKQGKLFIEVFSIGLSRFGFSGESYNIFITSRTISIDELMDNYKIVPVDVIIEHLKSRFIEDGFKRLKANEYIRADFADIFETPYKEKGGENGD